MKDMDHRAPVEPAEGVVLANHGGHADVLVDDEMLRCVLRGRLKKDRDRRAAPLAAGDRVLVRPLERGRGVIEEVLPRQVELARAVAGPAPLQQTLAANVEQAVIVFAAAEPRADLYLLDRFLAMAVVSGLEPLVCINKCDLVEPSMLAARYGLYPQLGFPLLYASAWLGEGVEELRAALQDRRSVLCGPSGVGKSSLLNAVAPGLALRTGAMGGVTHKGRHTTSGTSLLALPFGGWVADTPGLRQVSLWQAPAEELAAAFPDLQPYLGRCRYTDCLHRQERGCALRGAVMSGLVQSRRLRSYLEMGGG